MEENVLSDTNLPFFKNIDNSSTLMDTLDTGRAEVGFTSVVAASPDLTFLLCEGNTATVQAASSGGQRSSALTLRSISLVLCQASTVSFFFLLMLMKPSSSGSLLAAVGENEQQPISVGFLGKSIPLK